MRGRGVRVRAALLGLAVLASVGTGDAEVAPVHSPARAHHPVPVVATTDEAAGERTAVERTGVDEAAVAELRALFPDQYKAEQSGSDARTYAWALLIGINDYAGRTRDTIGSRPDAESLRKHLLSFGWRSDHIMLLTDRRATARRVVEAIRWLASKTDSRSTVVFHYAGHEKPLRAADGDRERRDVAIWAADNRLVVDGTVGRELGRVRARRMWIAFATCRAGGFNDRGTAGTGRVITYSSPEKQYSYEDPEHRHSVMGYFLIVLAMTQRMGDRNGDRVVTVEEAFSWARAYVSKRTRGRQQPLIDDRLSGSFSFVLPKPKPRSSPSPSPRPSPSPACVLDVIC